QTLVSIFFPYTPLFRSIRPKVYAQVRGNEAIVSMVSLGFGIGVAPQIVLENSPLNQRIKVLPISPALAPYDIGLFALKERLSDRSEEHTSELQSRFDIV